MQFSEEPRRGTFISDWLYVHTGLIWANEREVEPEFLAMNPGIYYLPGNTIAARLIKRGEARLNGPNGIVKVKEHQWVFTDSTTDFVSFQAGSVILSVRFTVEWPTGESLYDHHNAIPINANEHQELTLAAEALKSIVSRVSGQGGLFHVNDSKATVKDYFAIRQGFEVWLSAYVSTMEQLGLSATIMSEADQRILTAARLIDSHPMHLPFNESELARKVGLSVSQLNRLFIRDLKTSPKKYAERRRLEKAMSLLHRDRHSVKETALDLGFNSLSHFSAWFRRQKGTSPRQYLQNYRH